MADQPTRLLLDSSNDKVEQSRVMIDALRESLESARQQVGYSRERAAESWERLRGSPPPLVDDARPQRNPSDE